MFSMSKSLSAVLSSVATHSPFASGDAGSIPGLFAWLQGPFRSLSEPFPSPFGGLSGPLRCLFEALSGRPRGLRAAFEAFSSRLQATFEAP